MLHSENLSVGYGGKALLEEVCLSVRPGQILTLVGPNGVGKSTLLKTLSRLLAPVGGAVFLEGKELRQLPERELALQLSILTTERVTPELMRCEEVVASGRYPHTGPLGLLTPADRAQVDAAMALVGVEALREQEFRRLSDGQRQRVMLARAICQEPRVMVLDEPTSYLDIRYKLELLELLKKLVHSRDLAVVMSLHELDLAQKVSDLVLCVGEGGIQRWGTPEEVFTAEYIHRLYGVTQGSFEPSFGSLELPPVTGEPEVFVIGGGGRGIPVYRRLQRQGVPFGAGVLQENDWDIPVARALAARLITQRAFEPIGPEALAQAAAVVEGCRRLVCCVERFGTMNQGNQRLVELARQRGISVEMENGGGQ